MIKWGKQDVVNRIHTAMNEQPQTAQSQNVIQQLLDKARQSKQGRLPQTEL